MVGYIITLSILIILIPIVNYYTVEKEYKELDKYEFAIFNIDGNNYQAIFCFTGLTSNVNDKLILINPEEDPDKSFAVLREKDTDIKVYDIFNYENKEVITILKENNEKTINTTIFNLLISGDKTKQILGINLYKNNK